MEIANCLRCKKIFTKLREPICEECKQKDEDLFTKVREYLEENPISSVQKISEETGAPTKKILAWLREGRLETAEATGELKCRQCGVDITTGELCEPCIIELNRKLGGLFGEKPKSPDKNPDKTQSRKGVVMHTKNRK